MAAERTVRVWEWIAAAHDGDGPVSVAAVGRSAVRRLAVDGASVTAVGGPMAREPLFASDAVAAGARAIFAVPLQAGAIRVGVLPLDRAGPARWRPGSWPTCWSWPASRCRWCWMPRPG